MVHHSVAKVESIDTPAGTFTNAVRVVATYKWGSSSKTTITQWFAPGVGVVKRVRAYSYRTYIETLVRFRVNSVGEKLIAAAVDASELVVVARVRKPGVGENLDKVAQKGLAAERRKSIDRGKTFQLRLVIDKVLKGKLDEKEIVVAAKQEIGEGKWVFFLGRLAKEGHPMLGPALPAQQAILRNLDLVLNPPKPATFAERLARADVVIAGKAVVREERGHFTYWVFKIEKTLKGGASCAHVDVLADEELELTEGERYILVLKAGKHHGRKLYEILGGEPDACSREKLAEYEEVLKK